MSSTQHVRRRRQAAGVLAAAAVVCSGAFVAVPASATNAAGTPKAAAAQPSLPGPTVTLVAGEVSAEVSTQFPQVIGYDIRGAMFAGQAESAHLWSVNGVDRTGATTASSSSNGSAITYVSTLDRIDVTITSTIRVADDATVVFTVDKVAGADPMNTLALAGNTFLSANATQAAVLSRTVVSPDSRTDADEHLKLADSPAAGTKGAAYAFLSNGPLVASVLTNATTQESGTTQSWNTRLTTQVTEADGRTASIGSAPWLIHPTTAVDPRVTTYELPKVTVLFAGDRNDDGAVDWQDGGIRLREVAPVRLGAKRVPERVVNRIPFNFASEATNYFDLALDNTKRIANSTDGLGQWVLNKGYGSEGHDSANTDYGGNYNTRAGGLDALNNLVEQGKALNADMTVHVNATEIYPQARSFDPALLTGVAPYTPGWDWLDQSFRINQQTDLGTGRVIDRFQQLRDEVPGLSGVYIDVYYSNGWVAEALADQITAMGLEIGTEWGNRFVDNAVWAHWPNDLSYGGVENKGINSTMIRFMQNSQADLWNDDALLGQQRLVDAEGWTDNSNWDGFMQNIWSQSLPTKFIQHFPLLAYAKGKTATLTDDVAVRMDGDTRVITVGGKTVLRGDAYLLPWQSVTDNSATGSPLDADKMYFYTGSAGSKTFDLTAQFAGATEFELYRLTDQGRLAAGAVSAVDGTLTIAGDAGVAYVVVPKGGVQRGAVAYRDAGLDDPGFNAGSATAWHPQGDVSIVRNNGGSAKADPSGDNIAKLGSAASSISQTVTGLEPGTTYAFSAQVQIDGSAKRAVTIAAGDRSKTWELSPSFNFVAADSKGGTHFQRASVSFTAPESGQVDVSLSAAAGDAAVYADNARIMLDTTAPTAQDAVYSADFEGNQPGWGPFVKGDAGGITDARTSISVRHDPYTGKAWRNTAKPHDPSGSAAGLAVDSVLGGTSSLMSHSENTGLVYRTDPTTLGWESGHTYRVAFDYQTGAADAYRWVEGIDTLQNGASVQSVLTRTPIDTAFDTARFTRDIAVGCGDNTWMGLERLVGTEVDFVLDNFVVTDLGATEGGAACASVNVTGGPLNPGAQALITTTFTNTERADVSNVGVQLQLPEGYQVQVADGSTNVHASVKAGASAETTWVITAPASAAGAQVSVEASATYLAADCAVRTVRSTAPTQVADRARIPNSTITASASSEESDAGPSEGPAKLMLDGDASTIWHSRWSSDATSYPHVLTFDLGSAQTVDGISYLRRSANKNGPIKDYRVQTSVDGTTYTEVAAGAWRDVASWQDVDFTAVSARYVKVTALSSISGTPFAAVAELAIYGTPAQVPAHAPEERAIDSCGSATLTVQPTSVAAGSTVQAALSGVTGSGDVELWLDGVASAVGTVQLHDGTGSAEITVPASLAAGAHTLTAKRGGIVLATTSLTVQDAAPVAQLTLAGRCVAGKVTLTSTVTMAAAAASKVAVSTAYGAKSVGEVAAGKSTVAAFATKLTAMPAGEASAAVTVDGAEHAITAQYPALTCG